MSGQVNIGRESPPFRYETWNDWLHLAACFPGNGKDPDLFFPEATSSERGAVIKVGGFTFTERRAKTICAGCPVRVQCLSLMYQTGEQEGIWGGTTERERKRHRHAKDCLGCLDKTVTHTDTVPDMDAPGGMRIIKQWSIYGCKPVVDRVRDLLSEMDEQAVRNGFTEKEGAA